MNVDRLRTNYKNLRAIGRPSGIDQLFTDHFFAGLAVVLPFAGADFEVATDLPFALPVIGTPSSLSVTLASLADPTSNAFFVSFEFF